MERGDYGNVVRQQDVSLKHTIKAVRSSLASAPLPRLSPASVVGIIAMGASTYAGEYLVHTARQRGRIVVNWAAADWRAATSAVPVDLAIAISESGRSPETIDALTRSTGHRVALTNVPGSPVTEVADSVVSLGEVLDAGVYVSGYTSTVAALALIGEAIGVDGCADCIDDAPDLVRDVLAQAEGAVSELLAPAGLPTSVECVGAGASYASASETALLLREAGRIPSAAFPTDQYLHGPAEALPGSAIAVVFGGGRADELVRLLVDQAVPTLHASVSPVGGAVGVQLPETSPVVTAIVEALVGQVLAGQVGAFGGYELGTFRHEFNGTKLPLG